MDEIHNANFEELDTPNDAPVEPVSAEIFPDSFKNEEIFTEEPFEQNEVNTTDKEVNETTSFSDRIADYLGIILSLIVMTALTGLTLAFFLTFIPTISFTFFHFLKCWAGVGSALLVRGILKTNI